MFGVIRHVWTSSRNARRHGSSIGNLRPAATSTKRCGRSIRFESLEARDLLAANPLYFPGLYAPASSTFFLRNTLDSGPANEVVGFGAPGAGWLPVVGDWEGDIFTELGVYDPVNSIFHLRSTLPGSGPVDVAFGFGPPGGGMLPIAGDWNNDGVTTVGLYDRTTAQFYLRNSNTTGAADLSFGFGSPGNANATPIAGDWNGAGAFTIGLVDTLNDTWFLRNSNTSGIATQTFAFGPAGAGWKPLTGDWSGDAITEVGLYNPSASQFYLRSSNATGIADISFGYGPPGAGWLPLAGNWEGATPPLTANNVGGGAPHGSLLSQDQLPSIVNEAVARWAASGMAENVLDQMRSAQFVVSDLNGPLLGTEGRNVITIDRDAAGHGWFVDPTPALDEEFARLGQNSQLQAVDPRAVDRMDLLTVVEHELGHAAGLPDLSSAVDNVMSGTLGAGVRRIA